MRDKDAAPMKVPQADYDSPWKEMLHRYFEEFTAFFFPEVHAGIDWSRKHEFMDKEFQRIVRDAELGRRFLDKLVRVRTKAGEEARVLIHIEVQGQQEEEFAKRIYVYHYRIFDRYDCPVVNLAVLADDRSDWRPRRFGYALWGCEMSLTFPVVKLTDYETRWEALEASENPFSVVVMSHLRALTTRRSPEDRLYWKLTLVKMLYRRGYPKQDILELFRFIDWVMALPEELENRFTETLLHYEEENNMPYVTSVERRGIKKGRFEGALQTSREALIAIVEARFGTVPAPIAEAIQTITDLTLLKTLLKKAATAASLEEFGRAMEGNRRKS